MASETGAKEVKALLQELPKPEAVQIPEPSSDPQNGSGGRSSNTQSGAKEVKTLLQELPKPEAVQVPEPSSDPQNGTGGGSSNTENSSSGSDQKENKGLDKEFQLGVAVSVYQNSGDPNSNWAWFEKQKAAFINVNLRASAGDLPQFDDVEDASDNGRIETNFRKLGPSVIVKDSKIGKSSDFWNRYKEDMQRAKDIGCNSFRISIEWSRLYPRQGQLNQEAVDRYHAMFDEMDRLGLTPNVTLHWFVHPRWFDELGGFAKQENVDIFVDWAKTAFELYGKRSKLWATFNEIGVAAMCGWITGNHPPGKLLRFRTAAHVMKNMLLCHARAYKAIKSLPGGQDVQVGLVHNVFWTEPKKNNAFYTHAKLAVGFGNRVWGNETIMRYLKTGVFHHWVPIGRAIHYEDPEGKPGCDWFGVNHYSRGVVNWTLTPCGKKDQAMTDMGYPVYPPSLYRAVSYAAGLGIPIYIMENGMPSKEDDEKRGEWIQGCLSQVEKLVEDGVDIRGYMYWTLVDNFEWNFAWELKFGLYEWTPDQGMERKFRSNAKVIKDLYKELPERLNKGMAKNKDKSRSVEEQLKKELEKEVEYLREVKGFEGKELDSLLPGSRDPVTSGVKKPNGVLRCTDL